MNHVAVVVLVALSAVMHPCRPSPPPDEEFPVSAPAPAPPPADLDD